MKYREFKFRAWDSYHQEMINWSQYKDELVSEDFINHGKGPLVVMQYTGLKDKNGVEIYEGDILLGHSVYPECNMFEFKLIVGVYYSSRGTWDCYSYTLGGFNEQVEVIGNIYENVDLLEVEE